MFIPCMLDIKRTRDSLTTLVLMLYIGYYHSYWTRVTVYRRPCYLEKRKFNMYPYNPTQCRAYLWNTYNATIRQKEYRRFYKICLKENITPEKIKWDKQLGIDTIMDLSRIHNRHIKEFEQKLLKMALHDLQEDINRLYRTLKCKQVEVTKSLPSYRICELLERLQHPGEALAKTIRMRHRKKLQ